MSQYQLPGVNFGAYLDDTSTNSYAIPGVGFINGTTSVGGGATVNLLMGKLAGLLRGKLG